MSGMEELVMAMILEHVNYSYGVGTGKEFHALKDINLQIGDHEFIGLVGHSGSGKSTLIQLMNGLLRATEGTIYWDGQDIYDKLDHPKFLGPYSTSAITDSAKS